MSRCGSGSLRGSVTAFSVLDSRAYRANKDADAHPEPEANAEPVAYSVHHEAKGHEEAQHQR